MAVSPTRTFAISTSSIVTRMRTRAEIGNGHQRRAAVRRRRRRDDHAVGDRPADDGSGESARAPLRLPASAARDRGSARLPIIVRARAPLIDGPGAVVLRLRDDVTREQRILPCLVAHAPSAAPPYETRSSRHGLVVFVLHVARIDLRQQIARLDDASDIHRQLDDLPDAFDLMSTGLIGSTTPVACTRTAMSPRVTEAVGSAVGVGALV